MMTVPLARLTRDDKIHEKIRQSRAEFFFSRVSACPLISERKIDRLELRGGVSSKSLQREVKFELVPISRKKRDQSGSGKARRNRGEEERDEKRTLDGSPMRLSRRYRRDRRRKTNTPRPADAFEIFEDGSCARARAHAKTGRGEPGKIESFIWNAGSLRSLEEGPT